MEKILKITEIFDGDNIKELGISHMDGFKVETNEQNIFLMIDNDQCCCENWGYFMTECDLEKFIGSELIDIKIADTLNKDVILNGKVDDSIIGEDGDIDIYEGDTMFVDIITSEGILQFVAYNEHNGYYGHDAKVISTQLMCEETL